MSTSLISTASQLQTEIHVGRYEKHRNDVNEVADRENEMSKVQFRSIDGTHHCQKYNSIPTQTLIKLCQAEQNDTSVTLDTCS